MTQYSTIIGLMLALVCAPNTASAESYESFTEPDQSHEVAAAEIGTVGVVHVKRGQRIKKGDLLVTLDLRVLNASYAIAKARAEGTARLRAAEAELAVRQRRLKKLTLLKDEGAGSSEEVERATADVRVSESSVAAANEEIQLNRLEMDRIQAQIERNQIRSPLTGFVTKLDRKVGEFVSQNEPNVATVVNIDQLRARFHVATHLARQLSLGSRMVLTIPNHNGQKGGSVVNSIVDFVSPITDPDSGTVHIEVVFKNPKHSVQSGVRCVLHPDRIAAPLARDIKRGTSRQ